MIPIPKDRFTIFTNYQSVTKDQVLKETFSPYSTPWFMANFNSSVLLSVTVEGTITRHDVIKGLLSKVGLESLVHTT